jgi:hypothetical protein
MKTIREHLDDLPEPARSEALANAWWEDLDNKYEQQARALRMAFNWSRSPQGYDYWSKVCQSII